MNWLFRSFFALALLLPMAGCTTDPEMELLPPGAMDARGGTLEFDNGNFSMVIPARALDRLVTFTVERTDDDLAGLHGPQYKIGPDGVVFDQPVDLRLKFDPADLTLIAAPKDMIAAIKVGDDWQGVPDVTVDLDNNLVVMPVSGIGAPETVEVDLPDPVAGKVKAVVYIDGGFGTGAADVNDISLKPPRYVDGVRGTDLASTPGSERGTIEAPWKTVTFGVGQTGFGQGNFGEKLVVLTAAEYAHDNGESYPLTLSPHMALLADAGATLKAGPMQDVFRVPFDNVKAQVEGFTLESEEDLAVVGHRNRGYAAFVENGNTVFKNCNSQFSWGFLQNGGELEIEGGGYRDVGAHVQIRGGTLELDGCSFRDTQGRPGVGVAIREDKAAVVLNDSFGTPVEVTIDGATIRDTEVGVWVPNGGDLTIKGATIRSCTRYGIELGSAPRPLVSAATGTSDASIFDCTFRSNTVSIYLGSNGNVRGENGFTYHSVGEDNMFGQPEPRWWFGPGPWPGGLDIVYALGIPDIPAWYQFTVTGAIPPAVFGATMGFDRERGDAVLFGGKSQSGALSNDTWLFDIYDFTWTQALPAPPTLAARMDAAMGYDPRFQSANRESRRCYLFGGHTDLASDTAYNDLWVFDGAQEEWILAAPGGPAGPGQPGPRYGATLTWLSGGGYLLLGGFDQNGTPLGDAWEFDPAMGLWTPISVLGGFTPRAHHSTINLGSNRLFTFGGLGAGGSALASPQIADYGSVDFVTVTDEFGFRTGPMKARAMGSLFRVADNASGLPVFVPFGGWDGAEILEFGTSFVPTTTSTIFTRVREAAQFDAPAGDVAPSPRQRFGWTVIDDLDRGQRIPILFGGDPGDGSNFLNDTWGALVGPRTS